MKIDANDLRPGDVILHDSRLWRVTAREHTKPGKGGAYIQAELKDFSTMKTKKNERFRSRESVEKIVIFEETTHFSWVEGDRYVFTEPLHHDIRYVHQDLVGIAGSYLQHTVEPVQDVTLYVNEEGEVVRFVPPSKVAMEVIETAPAIKGQTATKSYKPALLSNKRSVDVPEYVSKGQIIAVNPETEEFQGVIVDRRKNV